jgi:hypothetical protein
VPFRRCALATLLSCIALVAPAGAARQIVDLHKLDAYFALFASDSNVPWTAAQVRLDTYSGAPVDFSVYDVDPADVVTAGSNERNRAIDTRGRRPIAKFTYTPSGGYQFESNEVDVPLGSREGFFVVEARRGDVGEQVWINRTRVGLITKETPGELVLYGTDLGSGRALANMRVQFVVNGEFVTRQTDSHGTIHWNRGTRPIFALAQWGGSYAFATLLPQAPLPSTIVGVRAESAVVHAGDTVRVVGFARVRSGALLKPATGAVAISMRLGAALLAQTQATLDAAGAFSSELPVPPNASAGDYAVLAQLDGGVGGASVHVDADASGLSLKVGGDCENCDPDNDVPVTVTSSQPGVAVHVTVVRSPHVYVGYTPDGVPWGTVRWFDENVRAGGDGRVTFDIPHPTDGLSSTYGVRVDAGGATAVTRIVVPAAHAALRLMLDRNQQTLGTPINFDVYGNDVASGNALAGAQVTAQLQHGPSVQQQTLTLDGNGHAHGTFSSPTLGTNLVLASTTAAGAVATDAGQVDVVAQATQDTSANGSSGIRIDLDRAVYRAGDDVHVDASLDGAEGDAFITLESAQGAQTLVTPISGSVAHATFKAGDVPGDLRVGAAFVRDGAIEWSTVPLTIDAAGRPQVVALGMSTDDFAAGATASVTLRDTQDAPGTVAVRISRGAPSGSALFDSAPSLLAVGTAATQVTAPAGRTWHPWVDSTGEHAQILGFERRSAPPADLSISDADTQAVQWILARDPGQPIAVQLPQERGRYTLSIMKMSDDGRVVSGSSTILVH